MNRAATSILKNAQLFAARFGFLTQDIFFRHICAKSRTRRYLYWKRLLDDGWFVRSSQDQKALYLSRKSRRQFGNGCVPARSPIYFEHDSAVAELHFHFSQTGLVIRSWTEADLSRAPWESYQILGTDRVRKIPDLILDLSMDGRALRVAVEIEKTRKARGRYAAISLAYLEMSRIDLVIFGCDNAAIASEVRAAFRGEAFSKARKEPGVFLLEEMFERQLDMQLRFAERDLTLRSLLDAIAERRRDQDGTRVPLSSRRFSESDR